MTYAAPLDIKEAVAPDGNVTGTCGELGDDQLQRHISRAQQLVDGVTGVAFEDSNAPVLLSGLVIALASYYATLSYRKGLALEPTHPVALQYADAQATLKGIQTGVIKFEPDAPDTDTTPQRVKPKVFNAGALAQGSLFQLRDLGLTVTTDPGSDTGEPEIDLGRSASWYG